MSKHLPGFRLLIANSFTNIVSLIPMAIWPITPTSPWYVTAYHVVMCLWLIGTCASLLLWFGWLTTGPGADYLSTNSQGDDDASS